MSIIEKMEIFSYSSIWLEYGFLSEISLDKQYKEYLDSNDKNIEHYRYKTLINWLNNKKTISNQDLINILKIHIEDNDKFMIDSFIITLIKSNYLSEIQLSNFYNSFEKNIQQEIDKLILLNKLEKENLDDEIFHEVLESKNNVLILKLIEKINDVTKLEYIIDNNLGSKKIKNIIKQKLLKFRKN